MTGVTLAETSSRPLRGSGEVACCGGHRARCLFGRQHSWSVWYREGKLVRTSDTYHCHVCDGVCTADEEEATATASTRSALVTGETMSDDRLADVVPQPEADDS